MGGRAGRQGSAGDRAAACARAPGGGVVAISAADQATLDFYEREAARYVARSKDWVDDRLASFMEALPPGSRVLELGCGGGRDAAAMLAHGLDVHPTDGTPAMATEAARRLGVPVRVMRFDELAEIEAYDAVWANASLLHVPYAALSGVIGLIYRAIKPGGMHVATYKSGSGDGRDALGRFFNYPTAQTLTDAYSPAGPWQQLSLTSYLGGGYEGGEVPWIAVTARKPSPHAKA